jgi:hypothetical protein
VAMSIGGVVLLVIMSCVREGKSRNGKERQGRLGMKVIALAKLQVSRNECR